MARLVILGIFGLLCAAAAQMRASEGANAQEESDIVQLKGLSKGIGNEEETGEMGKGEGNLVTGRNVTFEISGFSMEREVEDLVPGDEGEEDEEVEEDHGDPNIKEDDDWVEEVIIEGVKRSVLDHCNQKSIKSTTW